MHVSAPRRHRPATALSTLSLALLLAGCASTEGFLSGEKVDYRSSSAKAQPLEVPPDLTQLSRDSRYQPQGGVVSAAGAAQPTAAAPVGAAAGGVALSSLAGMKIERDGQLRWLVVPLPPEQLWPQLKGFWEQRGFTLAVDDPQVGVMETQWSENRARLPSDVVRNTIGRLLSNFYDTGERDRYRTRVERTAAGSEVYISHRGAEEVAAGNISENARWRARPSDPLLEAEFLSRLMVALGSKEEAARSAVAAAAPGTPAPAATAEGPRATAAAQATSLVVNEPFDRAWRRVGLALDRTGFTVEDRDRAAGLYYVRYIDPKNVGKEEPGFFARLFGDGTNPLAAQRFRVLVKGGGGDKTTVSVQTPTGAADTGENAQRVVALLVNELR